MNGKPKSYFSPALEHRDLPHKGFYGVFARAFIPAGELLVMWAGDIVPADRLHQVDPLIVALTEGPVGQMGPRELASKMGLIQVRDEGQLDAWCAAAIEAQPQAAADLAAGKEAAVGRLVGHVMKLSGGKVDAKSVQQKLREKVGRG